MVSAHDLERLVGVDLEVLVRIDPKFGARRLLDEIVAEAVREFAERGRSSLDAQVVWLLGVLEAARDLIATVHARAAISDAIRVVRWLVELVPKG